MLKEFIAFLAMIVLMFFAIYKLNFETIIGVSALIVAYDIYKNTNQRG